MLAEALRQFTEQLREMLERLLHGEPLSQEELERLGQMIGLNQADDLRYREWMAQRMERALRFQAVREALEELLELLAQVGMQQQRLEQMHQTDARPTSRRCRSNCAASPVSASPRTSASSRPSRASNRC